MPKALPAGASAWLIPFLLLGCTEVKNGRTDLSVDTGDDPAQDTLPEDQPADPSGDCPAPLVDCAGLCVDVQSNHEHCGTCGRACEAVRVCSAGECLLECPAGTELCSGGCVDTSTSLVHCGLCDRACTAGENADPRCEAGTCTVVCHEGWSDLNGDGACTEKRATVLIDNPGSDLADYQVYLLFDSSRPVSRGEMRPDCGDVRFKDSDGTTPLPYWIQSGENSSATRLWVRVPAVPAGEKTIYLDYGDLSLEPESSGDATFMFFDDFEDGTVDGAKWTVSGSVSEEGGQVLVGQEDSAYDELLSTVSLAPPLVLEMRGTISPTAFGYHHYGFEHVNFCVHWETNPAIEAKVNEPESLDSVNTGYNAPFTHNWKIVWESSGLASFYGGDRMDARPSNTWTQADGLRFVTYDTVSTLEILIVRGLADPVPTATVSF